MIASWLRGRSGVASEPVAERVDADELATARARVHEILRPRSGTPLVESKEELFAAFVQANRGVGIDPSASVDAGDLDVVAYPHRSIVPMQGDTYWNQGRVVSRETIDRRFRKLAI